MDDDNLTPSRKTYTFDEVYEWSNNLSKRKTSNKKGSTGKLVIMGSITIVLFIIIWVVLNTNKKKKKTEPEEEYINIDTGEPISKTEINSGEYEYVTE